MAFAAWFARSRMAKLDAFTRAHATKFIKPMNMMRLAGHQMISLVKIIPVGVPIFLGVQLLPRENVTRMITSFHLAEESAKSSHWIILLQFLWLR
jgi:hypothetical protein